jgi:ATP-binding cassette, subfamily B, bacterial
VTEEGQGVQDQTSWQFLRKLISPQRRALSIFGLTLGAAVALPISSALVLSKFVRLATQQAPTSQLVRLGGIYALLGLCSAAVTTLVTWRANVAAWGITNVLRRQLTEDVLRADLSFHRDRTPGELVTRVDADITSMTQFIATVVSAIVAMIALAIGCLIVALIVEPVLAPFLAVGFVGVGFVTFRMKDYPVDQTVLERAAEAEMMSSAEQYLNGAEDLASLGAGRFAVAKVGDHASRLVDAARVRVSRQMTMQSSISAAAHSVGVLMIGAGGWLVSIGQTDIAGVVLGFRLSLTLSERVIHLVWRLQDAQGAAGAARRVMELATMRREIRTGSEVLPPGALEVSFCDVELIYDDESGTNAAVSDLCLTLRPGRMLGVVGRTGSGKTSVARLLLRLVEPTAGLLTVGGVAIGDIEESDFRRRVTAVPQDVQLFPGTVQQNVTLFALRPTHEVIAALEAVGLGEWLQGLPDGLDTVLASDDRDDGGTRVGLSSGQAQLLALSRALLRNPSVVVLDEATSRIDPSTQESLAVALRQLVVGRTALVIAHRLETLEACDDIVVLSDGRVVEYGERTKLAGDPSSRYAQIRLVGHEAEELQ